MALIVIADINTFHKDFPFIAFIGQSIFQEVFYFYILNWASSRPDTGLDKMSNDYAINLLADASAKILDKEAAKKSQI